MLNDDREPVPERLNIVMTGGTSGLGRFAAQRMAAEPNARLLLGTRTPNLGPIEALPLELARLGIVREFAQTVQTALHGATINVLVLNAGTQFGNADMRTEDGFETTFAVNHLAHYLLLRLLVPQLAEGATVVITTSDTHDPRTNPLAPKHLDPEKLARPQPERGPRFRHGFDAYAASKLCNLLTARALATSAEAAQHRWRVIAYNPGATPGTSLMKELSAWTRPVTAILGALRPLLRLASPEEAGSTLADLATGGTVPPPHRVYASLVRHRITWPDPSKLAQRDDVMNDLWQQSAHMLGLRAQL